MHPIPSNIIAAAQTAHKATGIPASVSIAQWALESGWGQHMPPGSNNPFGMKCRSGCGDPGVNILTKEWSKARGYYSVNQSFRKFNTVDDAFTAHAQLLKQPVYAKARTHLPDAIAFAHALTGVYATDPKYGFLLNSIIDSNNLLQYDKVA